MSITTQIEAQMAAALQGSARAESFARYSPIPVAELVSYDSAVMVGWTFHLPGNGPDSPRIVRDVVVIHDINLVDDAVDFAVKSGVNLALGMLFLQEDKL